MGARDISHKSRLKVRCQRCKKEAEHEVIVEEEELEMHLCHQHMKYFRAALYSANDHMHIRTIN